MHYIIKLDPDHPDNYARDSWGVKTAVAIFYGMNGYHVYDDVAHHDHIRDVTDLASPEVIKAWICGSMFGWSVPASAPAVGFVGSLP